MKKILLLFVILLVIPVIAAAQESYVIEGHVQLYQEGGFPEEKVCILELGEEETKAIKNDIISAVEQCALELDISQYGIDPQEAMDLFQTTINENPILFHVRSSIGVSYDPSTGKALSLYFDYKYIGSEIEVMRSFVEAQADKVIGLIDRPMSDMEKALLVHEYLTVNFAYDTNPDEINSIRNIYDFFAQKKGVCQGYSLAYKYLLSLCGVDSDIVYSELMKHSWNVVKIDGEYYHVDVTWDDPLYDGNDIFGYSSHEYFLLSNEAISNKNHIGWSPYYSCGNKYDNGFWADLITPLCTKNGIWYCSKAREFGAVDLATGEYTQIYQADDMPSSFYPFMNVSVYENYLIFNTYTMVTAIDFDEDKVIKIAQEENIAGSYVWDGELIYYVNDSRYDIGGEIKTVNLAEFFEEVEKEPEVFAVKSVSLGESILSWEITADSEYEGEYVIYTAAYDREGNLVLAQKHSKETTSVQMPSADIYKVFVWSENGEPLCMGGRYDNH